MSQIETRAMQLQLEASSQKTMEEKERIVQPLKTLDELYRSTSLLTPWPDCAELRRCTDFVYLASDAHVPEQRPEKFRREDRPKTLVCHDMMGGYLEDKYIDGSRAHNSYLFYHWSVIDTFIYFSHNLVTIPPYGWINAAHEHGVKVLGTIITENVEGKAICQEILSSNEEAKRFANALILIARFYKFDGWLLNIENEIKDEQTTVLNFFVQYITENIHIHIKGSEIIWYDSVTSTGTLAWQNELNEKNECYFSQCDGIFLNYNWTDVGLIKSVTKAQSYNQNKGQNRVRDIYVGLDVWGRGCPGGGGFNSAYAMEHIRRHGLSVAIFAPAWTYENFGSDTFQNVENIYWAQLMPYLYIHVPIYDNEKFITSFCRGSGPKYHEYGMQVTFQDPHANALVSENSSFFNLSMQNPQITLQCPHLKFTMIRVPVPSTTKDEKAPKEPVEIYYETDHHIMRILGKQINFETKLDSTAGQNCHEFCNDVSYQGGGCIKLITEDVLSYHRLFLVKVAFSSDIQCQIIYRNISESSGSNDPILMLGTESRVENFFPKETFLYGGQWKMSIFQTRLRSIDEIGVAFPRKGNCYLGKITLQETRRPFRF